MLTHRLAQQPIQLLSGFVFPQVFFGAEFQLPEGMKALLAGRPFQNMAGRQFFNALDKRARAGHVVQRKVLIESCEIKRARNCRMRQQHLELRAEIDLAGLMRIIQRFDAHSVSGQDKPLARFLPERQSKHAFEFFKTRCVPLQESSQNNFGVGVGSKTVTAVS